VEREVLVPSVRRVLGVVIAASMVSALTPALGATVAQADTPPQPAASLVADIAPGPAGSNPQDLTIIGSDLFFSAWSAGHGRQLWESDGTASGTTMLTDVPGGANPQDLAVADGVLFFSARDAAHGRELWRSDGTVAGTGLVDDIAAGPAGSDPHDIVYAIGQQDNTTPAQVLVYFSAFDPADGWQLWKSDGTAAGTVMVSDVNPGPDGLEPADIAPLTGTTAMFSGDDGTHGREPWTTDGTTAGTTMYEDLNPGSAGSDPTEINGAEYNIGILAQFPLWYFSANDGTHGREFFVAYPADPPADVYDINPGAASSDPGPFVHVVGEVGLLAATTATDGRELFYVNQPPLPPILSGPKPGTATQVAGPSPGAGSNPVLGLTSLIGQQDVITFQTRNYFSGDDGMHGRQLWQADGFGFLGVGEGTTFSLGSVPGVRLVDQIGSAGSDPAGFANVGGTNAIDSDSGTTEVFSANDGTHGRELWTSDGWSTNTALAADINPGPGGSNPADITVIGQTAYFTAYSPRHGRELWKLAVPPAPQIYLSGPSESVAHGSPVTVTASLQSVPGDPGPTGNVAFYQDGQQVATAPLTLAPDGQAAAAATFTTLPGAQQIVAVYQGDGTYTQATSGTVIVTGE
jgi:ELWxxDGT repeat protein